MLRGVAAGLCGALSCALTAGESARAAEAPSRFDFRGLEHRYGDDEVLAAARDNHLVEVDWTVRIDADANGALRTLVADRSTAGF